MPQPAFCRSLILGTIYTALRQAHLPNGCTADDRKAGRVGTWTCGLELTVRRSTRRMSHCWSLQVAHLMVEPPSCTQKLGHCAPAPLEHHRCVSGRSACSRCRKRGSCFLHVADSHICGEPQAVSPSRSNLATQKLRSVLSEKPRAARNYCCPAAMPTICTAAHNTMWPLRAGRHMRSSPVMDSWRASLGQSWGF